MPRCGLLQQRGRNQGRGAARTPGIERHLHDTENSPPITFTGRRLPPLRPPLSIILSNSPQKHYVLQVHCANLPVRGTAWRPISRSSPGGLRMRLHTIRATADGSIWRSAKCEGICRWMPSIARSKNIDGATATTFLEPVSGASYSSVVDTTRHDANSSGSDAYLRIAGCHDVPFNKKWPESRHSLHCSREGCIRLAGFRPQLRWSSIGL